MSFTWFNLYPLSVQPILLYRKVWSTVTAPHTCQLGVCTGCDVVRQSETASCCVALMMGLNLSVMKIPANCCHCFHSRLENKQMNTYWKVAVIASTHDWKINRWTDTLTNCCHCVLSHWTISCWRYKKKKKQLSLHLLTLKNRERQQGHLQWRKFLGWAQIGCLLLRWHLAIPGQVWITLGTALE